MFRARENKKINDKERAAVVSFIQAGWSLNRIAQEVGCAKGTVILWKKRFDETGDVSRQRGSGRPRATSAAEDVAIRDAVRAKPITTAQEIAGYLYLNYHQL